MATTLATEKQAEAIKQRMAEIRTELPYSADEARHRVKQLTDWKYHMSRHALPIAAVTLVVGYLLVPKKRQPEQVIRIHREAEPGEVSYHRPTVSPSQPARKGVAAGIVGTLATLAMKQAASVAAAQISNALSRKGPS